MIEGADATKNGEHAMCPHLPATESRNPRTHEIDAVPAVERLEMIMREDAVAVDAARSAAPELARLVESALDRIRHGARVHYAGAGASGRLAMLDATEATPTFGVDAGLFIAHFPGGSPALLDSTIDLEDAYETGLDDLSETRAVDVVVGVTASGGTSYIRGALEAARMAGALTALLTSHPQTHLAGLADVLIVADTGPEALTGSTRLKAGTATKVMLNAFSTAVMIGLGRSYSNLMIELVASNEKLRERSVALLVEGSAQPKAECKAMLAECSGQVPLALLRLLSGASLDTAEAALEDSGSVRAALRTLTADWK